MYTNLKSCLKICWVWRTWGKGNSWQAGMLCKISKEGNSRAPRSVAVLTLSYSFPSYAGHSGVTPEIYVPGRNSGSHQICILILEFITPAFGELNFVIVLRMLGTARFFYLSTLKKSNQNKKSQTWQNKQTNGPKLEIFRNTKTHQLCTISCCLV